MEQNPGWLLDPRERPALLARFAPACPNVVAHHLRLDGDPAADAKLPEERAGEVVGVADDRRGVQALVVRIAGSTERPDGGTWRVTWSLAGGRRAKESNEVIAGHGWRPCDPVPLTLHPGWF